MSQDEHPQKCERARHKARHGEPMEIEWNISPGFTTLQLCNKVQEFLSKMSEKPERFTGRIIFMSMFNDISWGSQDNEQECELSANFVPFLCEKIFTRKTFLGLVSEKKWYSAHDSKPKGEWDRVEELMKIKNSESGHPVFRVTSPWSRGTLKSKGGGKISIHFCAAHRRLGPSRIREKTILIFVHSALCTRSVSFPTLAW